jgi:hypothetical protein
MTDPFYALMLMHLLGERYLVWDRAASIEFLAPGRGTVTARFALSPQRVDEIRAQAASGEKVLPHVRRRSPRFRQRPRRARAQDSLRPAQAALPA